MPFLRSLLLLLALASPAFSQIGSRDAATAQNALRAFGLYLDGVAKSGGQPDFTKPPAADLLRHIFDVAAFNALPRAAASDMVWLPDWGAAVDLSYRRIILYGRRLNEPSDLLMRRDMSKYQDQCAVAMSFMIRLQARQATALTSLEDQLPPEERRPAALQQNRSDSAQTITGAITAITQGMKPDNARLIAAALRDTRDVWAGYIMLDDRSRIAKLIADTPAADREAQNNLAVFAGALAAAK
jgi:hypothetical protein